MKICDYCGRQNDADALCCHECGTLLENRKCNKPKTPPETQEAAPTKWEFRELTPQEMELDLVTLIRCGTLPEADMVVSELRGAGISAFIPDEFLSQAVLWNLNAYGYVRVQVSPKDYASAKEFLLASPGNAEPGA